MMDRAWIGVVFSMAVVAACGGDDGNQVPPDAGGDPGGDAAVVDAAPPADAYVPVEVTFTAEFGNLAAPVVAWQDGIDGPWTVLDGALGTYTFTPTEGPYGLFSVCEDKYDTIQSVYFYATADELPRPHMRCNGSAANSEANLDVTIEGQSSLGNARITMDVRTGGAATQDEPTFSFVNRTLGEHDVVVQFDEFAEGINRARVVHDIEFKTGQTETVTINENNAPEVSSHTVSAEGLLGDETLDVRSELWTKNGTIATLGGATSVGVNQGELMPDDLHLYIAVAADNDPALTRRYTYLASHTAQNAALTLPAPYVAPQAMAIAEVPYVRVALDIAPYEGADLYYMYLRQNSADRTMQVYVTPDWLVAHGSNHWEQPDFSALDGWQNGWALSNDVAGTVLGMAVTSDLTTAPLDAHFAYERGPARAAYAGGTWTEAYVRASFTP